MSDFNFPSRGVEWPQSSLIWGQSAGHGTPSDSHSPLDGSLVQCVPLLSDAEQQQLLQSPINNAPLDAEELDRFLESLHHEMRALQPLLIDACRWETGFSRADCEELQAGALDYLEGFTHYRQSTLKPPIPPSKYFVENQERHIHLADQPWGTIAIVLPQNASTLVGIVALSNALTTGNRIILRPPLQCARSSALLAWAIERAVQSAPAVKSWVSLVMTRARPFLQELCAAPLSALIHYMGSSGHVPSLMADAWNGGKGLIADGTGNVWVWVGPDAPPDEAAQILTSGALRYNGQTCTSINGALIHPAIYNEVRERLLTRWQALIVAAGPHAEGDVGPLFDEAQATWCEEQLKQSGGGVLSGGRREGNLLAPTLMEHPNQESSLVREGVFGPALWISSGDADTFQSWWMNNRYPLCAGVLGISPDEAATSWPLRNVARMVVNGDPSVEHIYEPWGGYPSSGFNAVGEWMHKYLRTISLDMPAR